MTDASFVFKRSLALGSLSSQVANTEQGTGPLKGLGHTADQSVAVYRIGIPPAADKKVKLVPKVGGVEVIPDDHTKVAEGKVYVTGVITEVVAIRPK